MGRNGRNDFLVDELQVDPIENATDDQKLDQVLTYITRGHLEYSGGFPGVYDEYRGMYFIASVDDQDYPQLDRYKRKTLLKWYDDAVAHVAEFPDEDMLDAFGETRPANDE